MSHFISRIFSHIIPRFGSNSGSNLYPQTIAIISAMTVKPSSIRISQINTLVGSLLRSGAWSDLVALYILAAHNAQAALLNWKNPSGPPALAVGTFTFTADRGYSGDGSTAYLDSQIAWNGLSGTSQDNAHIGVYAAFGGGNAQAIAGTIGTSNVRIGRGAASLSTNLNNATNVAANAVSATAGTHLCASRSQSAQFDRYINGAAVTVGVQVSVAPSSTNFCGLRAGVIFSPSTASLRAMHAGPNLSAAKVLAVSNAMQIYMAAIGAN